MSSKSLDLPPELSACTAEQQDNPVRVVGAEQNLLKYLGSVTVIGYAQSLLSGHCC